MTAIAGVFGNPIEQSKSPIIHQQFAQQFGIALEYSKQYSELAIFKDDLDIFFQQTNAIGANVTMPFKELAFEWVDELSTQASLSGAVNTIIKKPSDDKYIGANTDGLGLVADFAFHGVDLHNKTVLLIGAGGAAKGALPAILNAGVSAATIYNRSVEKAEALIEQAKAYSTCELQLLTRQSHAFDVIINATSLSLNNELPNVSSSVFGPQSIVYDMVYRDTPTSFLQWAQQEGCAQAIDGLGMLVEQAAVSFNYWFDKQPDTNSIRQLLRKG